MDKLVNEIKESSLKIQYNFNLKLLYEYIDGIRDELKKEKTKFGLSSFIGIILLIFSENIIGTSINALVKNLNIIGLNQATVYFIIIFVVWIYYLYKFIICYLMKHKKQISFIIPIESNGVEHIFNNYIKNERSDIRDPKLLVNIKQNPLQFSVQKKNLQEYITKCLDKHDIDEIKMKSILFNLIILNLKMEGIITAEDNDKIDLKIDETNVSYII